MFNMQDSILDGITYDDLITAVISNERQINEFTVVRVFDEILQAQMKDARYLLNRNVNNIIKICKENREV